MNAEVVRGLLTFQPFRRFVLVTATGHEYEVRSPKNFRLYDDVDVLFWTEETAPRISLI